jgi:hypothetical protein
VTPEPVPAPITDGNLTGTVFEDTNNNGIQDNNETGVANIKIEIIDANGNILNTLTDTVGNYSVANIPEGLATITVDPNTLPPLATLTSGFNPNDVTIVPNTTNDAGSDGCIIPVPVVGSVTGTVKSGRIGISNVTVEITDIYNNVHTVITDTTGIYLATDIPVGSASVLIIDSSVILSTGTTATYDTALSNGNPTSVTVIENTTVDAGADYYSF